MAIGKIRADRERQRVDAAQLQRHRDEHADEHQAPRQVLRQQALDQRRHQRRLRRGDISRADAERVVECEHGVADDERRGDDADRQAHLLIDRRRADDVAGLQVLRGVAGIRRADADDRADRQRDRPVDIARPAERDEDHARDDQRRDRHAGDRVRRGADQAGDARRDRGEEEAEEHDEDRDEDVALRRQAGRDREEDREQQRAAEHDRHRHVALGARLRSAGSRAKSLQAFTGRRDDRRQRARQA